MTDHDQHIQELTQQIKHPTPSSGGYDPERERQAFYRDLKHMTPVKAKELAKEAWFLSQGERERVENAADALLDKWRAQAEQFIEDEFQSITGKAERAAEEADAIVAELDELIEQTEGGQVNLDDYTRRYGELQARLTRVQRNVDATRDRVSPLREKEEDPVAWRLGLNQRYRHIREGVMGRLSPGPTESPW